MFLQVRVFVVVFAIWMGQPAQLAGSVDINFKSETVDLNRIADSIQMNQIQDAAGMMQAAQPVAGSPGTAAVQQPAPQGQPQPTTPTQ